jgi:small conductance mechanosensitive channel
MSWLAGEIGQRALGRAILIAAVIVAAVVAWEIINAHIERRLTNGSAVGARARTLLPLGRSAAAIVIATFAVFTVLSEVGLDIGPLLAGAGVVGLAIGFGSQTLVKDVVTGVFILLENQIAVGDVVKAGDQSGLVEAITIRTLRLRDFDGTLRIVPFSAVTTVANMTKDYSRYVFDVAVSYREDVDRVIGALKEIGAEMLTDPNFGDRILGPLETFGIEKFDESAVIVRARITTKPIAQWDVGREFNMRLKKKFDALGIERPFPHRTIYFGVGKDGRAPPAHVALEHDSAVEETAN